MLESGYFQELCKVSNIAWKRNIVPERNVDADVEDR